MIYMTCGSKTVIVLEPGNLERLRQHQPIVTQDGRVLIAFTPDPEWFAAELKKTDGAGEHVARLIEEGKDRPEKPLRPYHAAEVHEFTREEK